MERDSETVALTWADAAVRLGIEVGSVKARARRGRWHRVTGNDGRVLVHVPIAVLEQERVAKVDTQPEMPKQPPPGADIATILAALEAAHVAELVSLQQGAAAALERLRESHKAELKRLGAAHTAEADRLLTLLQAAQRPWWKKLRG
jgi:hypothetical protein